MGLKLYHIIFWLALMYTPNTSYGPDPQPALRRGCKEIKPVPRDIIRRIYSILPYFDRDGQNQAFLQTYRATINKLSSSKDLLDREIALYAAILTPVVFLERYSDAKCLLERFERALEQSYTNPSVEKRKALRVLHRLREIGHKVSMFVGTLPNKKFPVRTTTNEWLDEYENYSKNKKDIRFLKELIKNLG